MTNRPSAPLTLTQDCSPLADEIAAVTLAAFEKQYGSGTGEAALIAGLRADGDVVVEFAALEDGQVVGHAMFSRLAVEPPTRTIAALAPVCARIDRQRSGIGSALIRAGLRVCGEKGFHAVAVLGDPDYYGRFGFALQIARALESRFSGADFQALELQPGALKGGPWRITYPRAFSGV